MDENRAMNLVAWMGEQLMQRAELEAMLADNASRERRGEAPAYPAEKFMELRNEIARNNDWRCSACRG